MRNHSELRLNLCLSGYVVVLMLFCVLSSPLINRAATDSSVFITMGRAMLQGKVMYRDVFDHKGLYLYFLNALAALLTGKSLLGLFIIECVFMFMCARMVLAVLSRYADGVTAFIGTQIFLLVVCQRYAIEGGNLTEEYSLMFQVCAVWLLVKDNGRHSCSMMMLQGILAGIVLCIRANMIMMWGGIALVAGIDMLIHRDYRKLAGNIASGIAGMIVALMPVVAYVAANDSLSETLFGMFGYNMMYMNHGAGTFIIRIASVMLNRQKLLLVCLLALSTLIMLRKCRKNPLYPYYWAMLIFSVVSVCLSGRGYGHYQEYLMPFVLPFAYEAASRIPKTKHKHVIAGLLVMTVLLGFRPPEFVRLMFGRQALSLDEFVRCNEPYSSEDERVLVSRNYAAMYVVLGVTPREKYFYVPATEYEAFPDPIDSQVSSILSGVNDVIVIKYKDDERDIYPESGRRGEIKAFLEENYNLLCYDEREKLAMFGRKR